MTITDKELFPNLVEIKAKDVVPGDYVKGSPSAYTFMESLYIVTAINRKEALGIDRPETFNGKRTIPWTFPLDKTPDGVYTHIKGFYRYVKPEPKEGLPDELV